MKEQLILMLPNNSVFKVFFNFNLIFIKLIISNEEESKYVWADEKNFLHVYITRIH